MHTMDTQDLITELESFEADSADNVERLRLAQAALMFAGGLLKQVADDTGDEHARAYLVDHLQIMTSSDHGFLSRDFNLDKWIEQLESAGDDDESDEDDE